jgi:hypothetical protein
VLIGPGADKTVTIGADGKPVAQTNHSSTKKLQPRKWSLRCLVGVVVDFLLTQIINLIYALLMRFATIKHRKQYTDTDYDYRFEVISAYARQNVHRVALLAIGVIALFIGYIAFDAFVLHWHGLAIVYVPPVMSNVTFDARASLNASHLLILFNTTRGLPVLTPALSAASRADFESRCDWRTLFTSVATYLRENRGREHCACAPMFGVALNHYAFETHKTIDDKKKMENNSSASSCESSSTSVVHLINLRDTMHADYEEFGAQSNESTLARLGPLAMVRHNQVHLFAWPNESDVVVVRRKTVRFRALDATGQETLLEVANAQAFCLSECYDLINGVSVYERARRQRARGINP